MDEYEKQLFKKWIQGGYFPPWCGLISI
jgi:hypothetical protein